MKYFHYSIIQFIPILDRNEVINIGVVIEDRSNKPKLIHSRFADIRKISNFLEYIIFNSHSTCELVTKEIKKFVEFYRLHPEPIDTMQSLSHPETIKFTPAKIILSSDIDFATKDLYSKFIDRI